MLQYFLMLSIKVSDLEAVGLVFATLGQGDGNRAVRLVLLAYIIKVPCL